MAIKDFFVQTAPGRRRYGVALLVGGYCRNYVGIR